jgi:hypothetical protein
MATYPNLQALLGSASAVQSLLSLENGKVTPLFLMTCSPGKMFHLGSTKSTENKNNDDASNNISSTPDSWIFRQPQITKIENARLRVKAANILAEAIKKCAAADHGHSSTDGSVGKENREKFEKRVELLIPKVEYIDEEDKQLAVPIDIHDKSQENKNAKHRSGKRFKNQKRVEEIEHILASMLARCATEEEKISLMRQREFQALKTEQDNLKEEIRANANITNNNNAAGGSRRDREGNIVIAVDNATSATNNNDDEYNDL